MRMRTFPISPWVPYRGWFGGVYRRRLLRSWAYDAHNSLWKERTEWEYEELEMTHPERIYQTERKGHSNGLVSRPRKRQHRKA